MKQRWQRWPAIAAPKDGVPLAPLWLRLVWMFGIWAMSVGVLLGVGLVIRWVLK